MDELQTEHSDWTVSTNSNEPLDFNVLCAFIVVLKDVDKSIEFFKTQPPTLIKRTPNRLFAAIFIGIVAFCFYRFNECT